MGSGGIAIEQDCVSMAASTEISMASSMETIFAVIVKLHSACSLRKRSCHCPVTISSPKVQSYAVSPTIICVVLVSVNLHSYVNSALFKKVFVRREIIEKKLFHP
ncbi:hypothetical protein AVEN_251776-1 [Araneus ventricosus]|uniref:Uncharacterized protein n=1 Tax=Araneus ventricosus TaxID=182803 RepID=A0A4Y2MUD1_ARAVE|nr:hypothetical protein AVEN_251776-1 [Araneus ventricosus]